MVMVAIIFVSSLFRHESFLETIQFILVLVVASIPVALPAVLSVTMAVGATVLAKKRPLSVNWFLSKKWQVWMFYAPIKLAPSPKIR
jgi:magnesium-transporting ATPase (P-type)